MRSQFEKIETPVPQQEIQIERITKIESLKKEFLDLMKNTKGREMIDLTNAVCVFTEKIEKQYGNVCFDYAFYHVLTGSTPIQEWDSFPPDKIDFSGELSVEKFIHSQIVERKFMDMREKIMSLVKKDFYVYNQISAFGQRLIKKYGIKKCNDYLYFCAAIGSTREKENHEYYPDFIDFPDEDSVEKFIDSLS